uniref:Glucosylceramidase n=1 Tax=Globodera rostochiensis TaxID=31243 RepID=A0A914GQ42_GLORO
MALASFKGRLLSLLALVAMLRSVRMEMGHESGGKASGCQRRYSQGQDSFVCMCDASHCDTFDGPVGDVPNGTLVAYVSDRKWKRLERQEVPLRTKRAVPESDPSDKLLRIIVNPFEKYQTILGFGGAFSDSSGINLNAVSAPVRRHLLEAYFHSEKGIRYTIGRVPIASTDFSTREYTYADKEDDFNMDTFALAPEDFEAKIPFIKNAHQLSGEKLRLIACPWTAPAWMKTNGRLNGDGEMKGEVDGTYFRAYAKYLVKFFEEYAKSAINFWALTIQNQPQRVPDDFPFQAMYMSNHTQREFAIRILSPLLKQSPHTSQLKLLAFDDVREYFLPALAEIFDTERRTTYDIFLCHIGRYLSPFLPGFMSIGVERFFECHQSFEDTKPSDRSVIDGFGSHWYTLDGHAEQDVFHEQHPDKIILSTEACTGFVHPDDAGPRLGNWTRGWQYGWDIVQNLLHWTGGWVDWNLYLDMNGGPNWVHNYVDAPIIVNAERDEFYKQPMFYFLAHFSRFMPPGAVRIGSHLRDSASQLDIDHDHPRHHIQHVSAITPTGQKVLVLINSSTETVKIRVEEVGAEDFEAVIELGPESILTAIWS